MSREWTRINRRKWGEIRLLALKRDGYRCRECSKAGRLEVDHIKRLEDGGARYELTNLQSLCRACHSRKTGIENGTVARVPAEWGEYLKADVESRRQPI